MMTFACESHANIEKLYTVKTELFSTKSFSISTSIWTSSNSPMKSQAKKLPLHREKSPRASAVCETQTDIQLKTLYKNKTSVKNLQLICQINVAVLTKGWVSLN